MWRGVKTEEVLRAVWRSVGGKVWKVWREVWRSVLGCREACGEVWGLWGSISD